MCDLKNISVEVLISEVENWHEWSETEATK